jgi:hypothetical protein
MKTLVPPKPFRDRIEYRNPFGEWELYNKPILNRAEYKRIWDDLMRKWGAVRRVK